MNRAFDGDFETRLGTFLLISFAGGHDVESVWHLANADSMIPDLVVSISRNNGGWERRRNETEVTIERIGPREFKDRLEDFLLTEYSRGEHVEGTRTIRYGWEELPEWTVEIERRDLGLSAEGERLHASWCGNTD